ncbi:hypothetical protein OSB04_000296 [Centaurea solstitialis]|uniref:Uncharacterized protein n=1 Tax=Centaurea solstitialis TaxID=347529 RepID=A0AA38TNS1_9ASTR|nr:hypothetical protein OSB04_000296 [Centaurea solstitialis]
MIFSHIVYLSLLFGAMVSWGIMWSLIKKNKGGSFPTDMPESSMKILNGYKVMLVQFLVFSPLLNTFDYYFSDYFFGSQAFISIAKILGDGLYNFVKILYITSMTVHGRFKTKNLNPVAIEKKVNIEELKQNERNHTLMSIRAIGYVVFALIAVTVIPHMFPKVKWYYLIIAYIFAPSLAFCKSWAD